MEVKWTRCDKSQMAPTVWAVTSHHRESRQGPRSFELAVSKANIAISSLRSVGRNSYSHTIQLTCVTLWKKALVKPGLVMMVFRECGHGQNFCHLQSLVSRYIWHLPRGKREARHNKGVGEFFEICMVYHELSLIGESTATTTDYLRKS